MTPSDPQAVLHPAPPLRDRAVKAISSFFYAGYLPCIPGTFGSLAGVGMYLLLGRHPYLYWIVTVVVVCAGFAVGTAAERVFGTKDPRYVVIDEVAGMLLCFALVPFDERLIWVGFLLFRALDTCKPYPANRIQNLSGAAGIMCDDLIAAGYSAAILYAVARLVAASS
jgi:phosphatidylglycerophosphatase A